MDWLSRVHEFFEMISVYAGLLGVTVLQPALYFASRIKKGKSNERAALKKTEPENNDE